MTDDDEVFPALLSNARRSAGLSQEELAERAQLSIRGVSNLERGRSRWPHPDTVRRLADALDLPGDERARFVAAAGRRGMSTPLPPDPAGQPAGSAGTQAVVPRQLPGQAPQFSGRQEVLAALTGVLAAAGATPPSGTVISVIGGMAGVGKTALAVYWAHQVAGRFPDGQLFVNLRGYDPSGPPVPPADAMRGLVEALGTAPESVPRSAAALAGLYRSLLAGRRVLLVLDNARDAAQVRPLLPGGPGSMTVVTSRSQLTGLVARDGAAQVTLDALSQAEAHELLARKLGAGRVAAESGAAGLIAAGCGGLPLALCITAARGAMHPDLPLQQIAAGLASARSGLDGLAVAGDPEADVRASFSWSYQSLSPAARWMFRLLGLHPGPDFSVEAIASLAGLPSGETARLLADLAESSLLSVTAGRFALHDLLRTYAAELVTSHDSAETRRAAVRRMLDYYLATAAAAAPLFGGTMLHTEPPPLDPGVVPGKLDSTAAALGWFTTEYTVLVRLVDLAAETGFDTHAWQLPRTLRGLFDWQARWADWEHTHRVAAEAATRLGDQRALAITLLAAARCYSYQQRGPESEGSLLRALELFGSLGDHTGQARTLIQLGVVTSSAGRYEQAVGWAERAYEMYVRHGDREGQAGAQANLGLYQYHLGNLAAARDLLIQARSTFTDLGYRVGEALAADNLGLVHRRLGDFAAAIACHVTAASLLGGLGDVANQAECLADLADDYHAAGQYAEAVAACTQVLNIRTRLHHPAAGRTRARLAEFRASAAAANGAGPPGRRLTGPHR